MGVSVCEMFVFFRVKIGGKKTQGQRFKLRLGTYCHFGCATGVLNVAVWVYCPLERLYGNSKKTATVKCECLITVLCLTVVGTFVRLFALNKLHVFLKKNLVEKKKVQLFFLFFFFFFYFLTKPIQNILTVCHL